MAREQPPAPPVLEGSGATLVLLASLDGGTPTWKGVLVAPSGVRAVGAPSRPSALSRALPPGGPAAALVDLVVGATVSYSGRFEELGEAVDELAARTDHPGAEDLSRLQRDLLLVHRHLARLERLVAELSGPLGTRFPGVEEATPALAREVARIADFSSGLLQAVRDLAVLRSAIDANRLGVAANQLARTSNEIAALANTSNLRMLGVAYVALAIALVSVVVLIPNTGATILGMPSAAWVPGIVVDVVLAVLAVVPIAIVFSRPWVRRLLASSPAYEARTAEGIADIPELSAAEAARPKDAERLIRQRP